MLLGKPLLTSYYHGFEIDDHQRCADWIRANLPTNAIIAQDDRVDLPVPGHWEAEGIDPLPQAILTKEFVADLGTMEQLMAEGVNYVVICNPVYGRFFDVNQKPNPANKDLYDQRRSFYQHVMELGQPIWQSKPGRIIYLQPGIRLYCLAPHSSK